MTPLERRGRGSERATRVLREEHRLILRVVARLDEIMDPGSQGPDLEGVEDCVAFFRLFVDACHHGQEEGLLFGELEAAGMPRAEGPLAVMLAEHRMGRALVAQMASALDEARAGSEEALDRLRSAALDYVDLIRGHIGKEDGVLFTHADHLLDEPACARLCAGYEASCATRFEGCTKAQLEALAERILTGAGPAPN
jgi:hemerythrin-like domain-containing protein